MTDPARPGQTVTTDQAPAEAAGVPAAGLPSWQSFARSQEWRRAQASASLSEQAPDLQSALSSLSAAQEDIRARRYSAAKRALNAYQGSLQDLAGQAAGDAALLQALAAPELLIAGLSALESASAETDPVALQTALQPAEAHALTRAEAHNALGVLHALRAEPDAARGRFEEALTHDTGHYRARMNLGNLALEAGDAAGAEAQYREVLKLAPEYDGAHHNLGVALRRQGKVYESVGSIRKAQRLNVRRSKQEARDDMKEQMRSNPQMRLIRNVIFGVIALVVIFLLLQGRP